MADIHLLLAGDIGFTGGTITGGAAVIDGTTGAVLSSVDIGGFEVPAGILGIVGDDTGYIVFGQPMAGFGGLTRYLDSGAVDFEVTVADQFAGVGFSPAVEQVERHGTGWLVRGNFMTINGVARSGFARLNADGTIDPAWPTPNTGYPSAFTLQDGKAVIAADETLYRVDENGVDGTFNPTTFPQRPNFIYAQPADNKLIVTGGFSAVGQTVRTAIQRIRGDSATADLGMAENALGDGAVLGTAQYGTGLLVFGSFTLGFGGAANRCYRLTDTLAHDPTFAPGVINGNVLCAVELPGDRILIGGAFTTVGGQTRQRIAVLNADGTLDATWVPPSINNDVQHVMLQNDGKILIAGTFSSVGGSSLPAIVRLNADGTLDAAYAPPVPVASNGSTIDNYDALRKQSDGKIILFGSHAMIRGVPLSRVARVDAGGTTAGFVDLAPASTVVGAAELDDGKIMIVGNWTNLGGDSTYNRIARLNANGTLDATYPATALAGNRSGEGILKLPSGRCLVTGSSSSSALYMLNTDGTLDDTYSLAKNGGVDHAALQSDGKIVLVGNFTSIGGQTRTRMARLNADGTLDLTFPDVALSSNGTAPRLFILDDDRIVLKLSLSSFTIGGQSRSRLALLSADGVVDATWNPAPNNVVNKVGQQSTGAIIVAGNFTSIGGQTRTRLARLNADGTADGTFPDYFGHNVSITDFHIDASDRIVTVGSGTSSNNWMRRVTPDNADDGTFELFTLGQTATVLQPLADGSYVVGRSDGVLQHVPETGGGFDGLWAQPVSGGSVDRMIPVASGTAYILIGGFSFGAPFASSRLTRLNVDGTIDTGYPTYPDISPFSISQAWMTPNDDLLLIYSNQQRFVRNSAGTLTPLGGFPAGFNATVSGDGYVYQRRAVEPFDIMRLGTDLVTEDVAYGAIVVTGTALQYEPDPRGTGLIVRAFNNTAVNAGGVTMEKVARLNADGSIDDTWIGATYSSTTPDRIWDAGDGKLYVQATWISSSQPQKSVNRLTTTGTFDNWISGSTSATQLSQNVAVDPSDYSVAGWNQSTGSQRRIIKYAADGTFVPGFEQSSDGNLFFLFDALNSAGPLRFLADGSLLVTGRFSEVARNPGVFRNDAAILDTSGQLVPDYDPGLVSLGVKLVDVHAGKHYFGATVTAAGAQRMPHVALRGSDGSYSTEFLTEPYLNPNASASGITATVNIVRMLPDGRAYIGGRFATLGGGITYGQGGYEVSSLARLLPDGSPDTSFANARIEESTPEGNPPAPNSSFPGIIRAIDIQPDGKLVVVGEFTRVMGSFLRPRICRLTDTGELDTPFFPALNNAAWAVKVRDDGKIWVGGRFTEVEEVPQAGIVLLNADGTVDPGFANPIITVSSSQYVHTLLPQDDGKLIAVGTFNNVNGNSSKGCRRFNADGTLDESFDAAVTGTLTAGAQDGAGKLYIGGNGAVFRLNPDGTADGTWTNPFTAGDDIASIVPLDDGTVLVGGDFVLAGRYCNVLLDATGAVLPDLPPLPLFHLDGTRAFVNSISAVPTPPMTMFPRFPTGYVYAGRETEVVYRTYGGTKPYTHELVGRLPATLTQDGSVVSGAPVAGTHYWKMVARDAADERIEHLTRLRVIDTALSYPLLAFNTDVNRIDPDGSNETLIVPTNATIFNAIRLPDRKILICGSFTTVDGQTRNRIARLNPDGTLDGTFTGPAAIGDIEGNVLCADVLSTGKYIIGTARSPDPYFGQVYRLNTDGTVDGTFTMDARAEMRAVQFIKVLENDELLIGCVPNSGPVERYDGAAVFLADATGAIDEAYIESLYPAWGGQLPEDFFTSTSLQMYDLRGGTLPNGAYLTTGINDIHVEPNGDFMVCGSFIQTSGGSTVTSETVARARRAGGHDRSFSTRITGIINAVNFPSRPIGAAMFAQPDGTWVVIGSFKEWGGTPGSPSNTVFNTGYAHINRNGDPATPPETWAEAGVPVENQYAMALPDGRIMTGGWRPGQENHRIFPDGAPDPSFTQPATVAARFVPDNQGIDAFTGDGTYSIGIQAESEEQDAFTGDGAFYFFGGQPPAPPEPIEMVSDGLLLGAALMDLPKYGLRDGMRFDVQPIDTFTGLAHALDTIDFGDALAVILRELLAEGFSFYGTTADNFRAIERLADALRLSGVVGSELEAFNAVAAAIAFADLARARDLEALAESLDLSETVVNAVKLGARMVEELLLAADGAPAVVFGAVVRDGFDLDDAGDTVLQAIEALREGVSFALHLNLDDGQYVAYVINTESKGTTQYTNYPFNSMIRLGDRYFGMTTDGIRELVGPDDAGSPIAARFRLVMSNLGTGHMKRMIAAYLGYTSTGELRIKTITVGVDGLKQENHYRLHAQPATAPRQARIKIGQGLRSVYWGFGVEAIDGAAFMIDLLDLQPIVVEQRIQGEGGGKR